jgi:uncharacterized protein with HEPN domain
VRDDRLYLVHMHECIGWIQEFAASGREAFLTDRKTQDAILRNLQTMAESSQRLSAGIKARRTDVEWSRIAAFRNVLVHDYLGIDLDTTWDIIQRDVPVLQRAIDALLATIDSDE